MSGPLEKSNETSTSKTSNGNVDEAISMQPTTKRNYIMSVSGETATPIPDVTTNRLNVTLPASESFERLLNTALPLSDTSTTSGITRTDNFNVSGKVWLLKQIFPHYNYGFAVFHQRSYCIIPPDLAESKRCIFHPQANQVDGD